MDNKPKHIFDDRKYVKGCMCFGDASCARLFALGCVIHRHVYHSWENLWGFHAIDGFAGCVVLVIVATWMRTFLMRSEDYYDDEWNTDLDEKNTSDTGAANVDD